MSSFNNKQIPSRVAIAVVAPLVLLSAYLWSTRFFKISFSAATDWVAVIISIAIGSMFMMKLPGHPALRAVAVGVYTVVGGVLLYWYSFAFVAAVFGEGL